MNDKQKFFGMLNIMVVGCGFDKELLKEKLKDVETLQKMALEYHNLRLSKFKIMDYIEEWIDENFKT